MKKSYKRLIALLLGIALFVSVVGKYEIIHAFGGNNVSDTNDNGRTFETDNYKIDMHITAEWDSAYNVLIFVENKTYSTIHNWGIIYLTHDEIVNPYNVNAMKNSEGYILRNAGYNQDIPAKSVISFGFTFVKSSLTGKDLPDNIDLFYGKKVTGLQNATIENEIINIWNGGYIGNIIITNNSNEALEDWSLLIENEDSFVNLWNGTISILEEENQYEISAPNDNQNIAPGSSIVVGYQAAGNNCSIRIIDLYEKKSDLSTSSNTINNEENGNNYEENNNNTGDINAENQEDDSFYISDERYTQNDDGTYAIKDYAKSICGVCTYENVEAINVEIFDLNDTKVFSGNVTLSDNTWESEIGMVVGYNRVSFTIDNENDSINKTVEIFNFSEENSANTEIDLSDSDDDGIANYYELLYGTDKNDTDTDDDGLTDLAEIVFTGTDPLLKDTDGNGILDAEEDFDNDNLNTLEEIKFGTGIFYPDTDSDGLEDGYEVHTSKTDPTLYDTDGDGYSDGEEINIGLNPISADSDNDGVSDDEELISQQKTYVFEDTDNVLSSVDVELSCAGSIQGQVFIKDMLNSDQMSTDLVGLVGSPIQIDSMTDFDEAIIRIKYDESKLNDINEDDLCLMWYDEDNREYVLLEDCILDKQNNIIEYTTTHFSTYMVVNKALWLQTMRTRISYEGLGKTLVNENYDLTVLVDYTLSYSELLQEEDLITSLINKWEDGDRVFVGYYDAYGSSTKCYPNGIVEWKDNKEDALKVVSQSTINDIFAISTGQYNPTSSTYDGAMLTALQTAVFPYTAGSISNNKKIAYIFYSGNVPDLDNDEVISGIEDCITNAINNGIIINTVSMGAYTNDYLDEQISRTGGKSYLFIDSIGVKSDYDARLSYDGTLSDSDGDGIPDIYEINGIRIQNGRIIYTNPNNADTDGDGVSDYEEMGGCVFNKKYYGDGPELEYVTIYSDPNNAEQDGRILDDNYILVTEEMGGFDYLPLPESERKKIYENPISPEHDVDQNGNTIYGRHNIYKSNPKELTKKEILNITSRAATQAIIAKPFLPFASDCLINYLWNVCDVYYYNALEILTNRNPDKEFNEGMFHVLSQGMNYIKEGETIVIANNPRKDAYGGFDLRAKDAVMTPDVFLSIGAGTARQVAKISFDGKKYTYSMKYYLFDYYDWDGTQDVYISAVSDKEMYQLCRVGAGKFYQNWGVFEIKGEIAAVNKNELSTKIDEEVNEIAKLFK